MVSGVENQIINYENLVGEFAVNATIGDHIAEFNLGNMTCRVHTPQSKSEYPAFSNPCKSNPSPGKPLTPIRRKR